MQHPFAAVACTGSLLPADSFGPCRTSLQLHAVAMCWPGRHAHGVLHETQAAAARDSDPVDGESTRLVGLAGAWRGV